MPCLQIHPPACTFSASSPTKQWPQVVHWIDEGGTPRPMSQVVRAILAEAQKRQVAVEEIKVAA
jgi:hypothetical protein